jgi:enamine deaminase RidA (YjgF/YER057c/UK114 family)
MSVYSNLQNLGITLPPCVVPAASYIPFVSTGNLVFLSGHISKKDGKPLVGQLGSTMSVDQARAAARAVAIDLLGTLQAAATGDLEKVQRILQLTVLVNSTADFTEHHLVANGASELFGEVFGEAGRHTRAAFGVAQIPFGCVVEIALVAELKPGA